MRQRSRPELLAESVDSVDGSAVDSDCEQVVAAAEQAEPVAGGAEAVRQPAAAALSFFEQLVARTFLGRSCSNLTANVA